jgi:hypothetical protein
MLPSGLRADERLGRPRGLAKRGDAAAVSKIGATRRADDETAAWNIGKPKALAELWTFTGTHAGTGRPLWKSVVDDLDLAGERKLSAFRSRFDPED